MSKTAEITIFKLAKRQEEIQEVRTFEAQTWSMRLAITVKDDGSLTIHSDGTMIVCPIATNAIVLKQEKHDNG